MPRKPATGGCRWTSARGREAAAPLLCLLARRADRVAAGVLWFYPDASKEKRGGGRMRVISPAPRRHGGHRRRSLFRAAGYAAVPGRAAGLHRAHFRRSMSSCAGPWKRRRWFGSETDSGAGAAGNGFRAFEAHLAGAFGQRSLPSLGGQRLPGAHSWRESKAVSAPRCAMPLPLFLIGSGTADDTVVVAHGGTLMAALECLLACLSRLL